MGGRYFYFGPSTLYNYYFLINIRNLVVFSYNWEELVVLGLSQDDSKFSSMFGVNIKGCNFLGTTIDWFTTSSGLGFLICEENVSLKKVK